MPLVVRLPNKTRWLHLQRAGVMFALANRRAETRLEGTDTPEIDLPSWRHSWAPAAALGVRSLGQGSLFSPEAINETSIVPNIAATSHVAFVNPHLAGSTVAETEVREKLRPWLRRLLKARDSRLSPEGRAFIESVGILVDELVSNVREHAPRDRFDRPSDSLVAVGLTGGTNDLVHVTVMDTGPGIVTTAGPKLPRQLTDADILRALLLGSHRGWDRGRGLGLPRMWQESERYGGHIFIATGRMRVMVRRGRIRVTRTGFDLNGSVVTASLHRP
jgi:hypothetical protein